MVTRPFEIYLKINSNKFGCSAKPILYLCNNNEQGKKINEMDAEKIKLKLTEITDADALAVINTMHLLTENELIGRTGILGLGFAESHRKYGDCYIEFKRISVDKADGSNYSESFTRIKIHHNSVWFEELDFDGRPTTYNKNHMFGYDKLRELGYDLPKVPQWT